MSVSVYKFPKQKPCVGSKLTEMGVLFLPKMLTIKSWFSMQLVTVLSNLLSTGSLSVCHLSGHHAEDWNVTKLLLLQRVQE